MRKITSLTFALGTLAATIAGCQGSASNTGSIQSALNADGGTSVQNNPQNTQDPFAQTAPLPAVAAHMHSCQKIPYDELGNLLTSRGVNLAAVAAKGALPTAGQLYAAGAAQLGAPNYAARQREAVLETTSGGTKLMDVFIAAAPEIIAAMPSAKSCMVAGQPTSMFDNNGQCTLAGITCLIGSPASTDQVNLCNSMLVDIPGAIGQQLAVAAIMAAAHTCE